jgi:hypothetical protein
MFKLTKLILGGVTIMMVVASFTGCSTRKNYIKCSPYVIITRDTSVVYILNTPLSPELVSIWIKKPTKPGQKIKRVIDSLSFNRLTQKSEEINKYTLSWQNKKSQLYYHHRCY